MKHSGSFDLTNHNKNKSHATIHTISNELTRSGEACQNEHLNEPVWKCRYVVTIVGTFVSLFASIHRTVMSVAIVHMVNSTAIMQNSKAESESCLHLLSNSTEDAITHGLKKPDGDLIWSPETQGYILGCFFFGQIFLQIPAARLAERYGCKWFLMGSVLATSVLTLFIPPFSWWSASALMILQTLRGFAMGVPESSVAVLMANWCPPTERGFLYSLIVAGYALGYAVGSIFAGYVCESTGGWPSVFYSVGGAGLVLSAYIAFFIAENPKEHPRISIAEFNYILKSQESTLSRRRPKLPYRQLLTSVPLYAVILAIVGRCWKYSQFFIVHSTFLGTILHYPIGQNGLFSAIPFLVSFIVAMVSTWISGHLQKKNVVSVDFLRKFWTFISALLYSLCLLGIYFAGCNRNLSVIFGILSMGLTGMGTPGCTIALQEMSPTFAGTLTSIISTFSWAGSVILPMLVGYLTEEMQTLEQWGKIFFISIGVVMSTSIVFVIFGSAKVQPWNFVEDGSGKSDEKQPQNDKNEETTRF